MSDKPSNTVRTKSSILSRCFWLLMGVAHTPALVSAWESYLQGGMRMELLGGCIVLTASMLLFALKTCDVAFLRLNPDRRALLAMVLAVGLIHFDCLSRTLDSASVANGAAIVATTSLAAGLTLAGRALSRALARSTGSSHYPSLLGRFTRNLCLDDSRPCCWVLALGLFALRAPPA
ncbi:MAG: hypothetical protein ACYTFA_12180 [Planctomycetota bacterium]|jgi:hypothetical protein